MDKILKKALIKYLWQWDGRNVRFSSVVACSSQIIGILIFCGGAGSIIAEELLTINIILAVTDHGMNFLCWRKSCIIFIFAIACILQKMFILLTSTYGIFLMPSKLVFVSCHRNYIKKTQSCFPVINFLTTVKWNNDLELTFTADDQWTGNEGFCTKKQKTKQKFDSLNSWTSSRILTIYLPVSYEIWFELGCIKV